MEYRGETQSVHVGAGNPEVGRPPSRGTPIPALGSLEKGGEAEKRG